MKYTKIEKGPNKGLYENEKGVIYTEKVALKRMAKPMLYDPPENVLANKTPKKKAKK